jgi:DNA-binding transcriptional ArsR family regulator
VFFLGVGDRASTIDQQFRQLAQYPSDCLKDDLDEIWRHEQPSSAAKSLVADGATGVRRLAEDLRHYWEAAVQPYWAQIHALLDGDVAHQAFKMAHGGIAQMISGLHPTVTFSQDTVVVRSASHHEHDLAGAGLLLVPSVFVWPNVVVDDRPGHAPRLMYSARGVGTLWQARGSSEGDALAGLLGRTRAAMLDSLALPHSTGDLARRLGQSALTVSAHLSILRRCGMVTSWPAGRRVLYQRTALASSLMRASQSSVELDQAREIEPRKDPPPGG